jgi:hypothetical protein
MAHKFSSIFSFSVHLVHAIHIFEMKCYSYSLSRIEMCVRRFSQPLLFIHVLRNENSSQCLPFKKHRTIRFHSIDRYLRSPFLFMVKTYCVSWGVDF